MDASLVVHGVKQGNWRLKPCDERLIFLPPDSPSEEQRVFARFGFTWERYAGGKKRSYFFIEIPPPDRHEVHYDLVLDGEDILTAKVGLRPRKNGEPDSEAEVLWHKSFEEPPEWHEKVRVVQGYHATCVYDELSGKEGDMPLVDWFRGSKTVGITGSNGLVWKNNLTGRHAIEAMIEGLQLVLERMDQEGIQE